MSFIWMFDTFIGQLAINFRRIFIVFTRFSFLQLLLARLCFFFSSFSSPFFVRCLFRLFYFLFDSLLHFDFISAHTIRTYDNNINSIAFLCVRSTHLFDFNRSITLFRFISNSCRFFRFSYDEYSSLFTVSPSSSIPFYFWSVFSLFVSQSLHLSLVSN